MLPSPIQSKIAVTVSGTDINGSPFEELSVEEIERLKEQEAIEAPSTAKSDNAWSFNSSFTGVRIHHDSAQEYLNALAEMANTRAEDYLEKRKEALHFIAIQTVFDFDKPVDHFVVGIVKDMGLSRAKELKKRACRRLEQIVYSVARRMIPQKLVDAYQRYPDAIKKMEGLYLVSRYTGLDGTQKVYNAWVELDLPAYVTSKDIHDEIDRLKSANRNFALRLEMAIRIAHRASFRYRKKSLKTLLKMVEIRKMTYGEFANSYPVTFMCVCRYVEHYGLNKAIEENAASRGKTIRGMSDEAKQQLIEDDEL